MCSGVAALWGGMRPETPTWRDQFAKINVFNAEDRKKLQAKWGDLLANSGKK
ncbi:MAG: hypothetical protein HW419_2873 [Deltaproteobacteria bacterium]|nr:hypothetical protein [Deltaproteobacteria bacterium]